MRFPTIVFFSSEIHSPFVQHRYIYPAGRSENLQRIPRLTRSVSHRQYSTTASLKLKSRDSSIFHLALEQSVGGERCDFCDATQNVRQHFNTMTAKIKHWSTTCQIPL